MIKEMIMICKHVYQKNLKCLLKGSGAIKISKMKCRLKISMEDDLNKKVDFNIALTRNGYVLPVTSDSCPLAKGGAWHNCPFFEILH